MSVITLVNPDTGVRFQYEGRWLRSSPATDTDIKRGRARFRGDKVHLSLPPGVQAQLDKGILQVDTDYRAREALDSASTMDGPVMPAGNASREAWISYAVSQGMDRDEASALPRDQLRSRFTAPVFDPDAPPEGDGAFAMLNDKP